MDGRSIAEAERVGIVRIRAGGGHILRVQRHCTRESDVGVRPDEMSRNVLELGACGARHTGPAVVDANADRTALEERRVELNTVMPAAADVGVSEGRGIEVDFVAYRHV